MYSKIQKWGNSQGVRIPKTILNETELHLGEEVEVITKGREIIIRPKKRHKSLRERFEGYNGDYQCAEWDTGEPVGNEVL